MAKKPKIRAYWWAEQPNFGDRLAKPLLEQLANVRVEQGTICESQVASIGSVLEHIPPMWPGYILGSGKMYEDSRLHLHTQTMKVLALRGPLTARQCPPGDYALGDPGLLAVDLVAPAHLDYDLGIVPHWMDHDLEKWPEFYSPKWTTLVIDPRADPLHVVSQIGSCRKIVTSSLHALIIADSFGNPRRFEPGPGTRDTFKFRDYHASISMTFEPHVLVEAKRLQIEDRRYELLDAYDDLGRLLRRRT